MGDVTSPYHSLTASAKFSRCVLSTLPANGETAVSYSVYRRSAGMEHAVLGAGAVGGFLGTALASLGEDITVLVRPERLPGYPANLSVERPSGTTTAPARAAASLTKPIDVLWIATKTYQLETALGFVQTL